MFDISALSNNSVFTTPRKFSLFYLERPLGSEIFAPVLNGDRMFEPIFGLPVTVPTGLSVTIIFSSPEPKAHW